MNATTIASFNDLPPDVHDELSDLAAKIQSARLPIEFDPVIPGTFATVLDGRIYRIAVVTDPQTRGKHVEVLDGTLSTISKTSFLSLLGALQKNPEQTTAWTGFAAKPPGIPVALRQLDVLNKILAELIEIKASLP